MADNDDPSPPYPLPEDGICVWTRNNGKKCLKPTLDGQTVCEEHAIHNRLNPTLATVCKKCKKYIVFNPRCYACIAYAPTQNQKAIDRRNKAKETMDICEYVNDDGVKCNHPRNNHPKYCGIHDDIGQRKDDIEAGKNKPEGETVFYCTEHLQYNCGGIVPMQNMKCEKCDTTKRARDLKRYYKNKANNA
jgi:hypothetical protein